ncbi:MAG: type II toxin-antitoxin system VapC family toxin [Saprospiraceae bacterium]
MKHYLLDTHTLLWHLDEDPDLSENAETIIGDPANIIHVSIASIWEIGIKHGLGRLDLPKPFEQLIPDLRKDGFELLPISEVELNLLIRLPNHHRDPFDRMLIAQSLAYSFEIIGRDGAFDAYGVQRIW